VNQYIDEEGRITLSSAPLRRAWYEVREWVTERGAEWWRVEDPQSGDVENYDTLDEATAGLEAALEEEAPRHQRDHLFIVRIIAEEVAPAWLVPPPNPAPSE